MSFFGRDLNSILRGDIIGIKPQLAPSGTIQGPFFDRCAPNSDGTPNVRDAMLVIGMTGAVSSGACSVTYAVQDADDGSGSGVAAYTPPNASAAAAVTLSGPMGSNSAKSLGVDLSGARRYVNITATVSASGADTVGVAAGIALGGARQNPPY